MSPAVRQATPIPAPRRSHRTVLDESTRPTAREPADGDRREMAQVRQVLDHVRDGTAWIGDARSEPIGPLGRHGMAPGQV